MTKPRPRTSQAARVSILKRVGYLVSLVRPGSADFHTRRAAVAEFFGTDGFRLRVPEMTAYDCMVAMLTIIDTAQPVADRKLIPPPAASYANRVKWDDVTIAKLRAIAGRYGLRRGLDREIAREMKLPLRAAIQARFRFVGGIEAPRGRRQPKRPQPLRTADLGPGLSGSQPPQSGR